MSGVIPVQRGRIRLDPGPLRFMLAEEPIVVAMAGIRGGKTHTGALKCLLYALTHPCGQDEYHFVSSPTFPMSEVPKEKLFRLLFDTSLFPVCPLLRFRKKDRVFELAANGGVTRIKLVSLHDPDSARGYKALSWWMDEGAYVTKYGADVVMGRLADVNGPLWVTTSPCGYNWLFELYERARTDRSIRFVHWRSTDNTHIRKDGLIRLANQFDEQTYRQEVEGLFVKAGGLVYHTFDRRVHLRPARFNPALPLWVGQDFNVDPMSSVFAQPFTTKDGQEGAHVVFERIARNSDTPALAKWLIEFCRTKNYPRSKVVIYADAAGRARSTAGKSDFKILRDAGFEVEAPLANPPTKDRFNAVNGLLAPMVSRHPRLLVDPDCLELIKGLEKLPYKEGISPPTPDKSLGLDHAPDGLGYLVHRRYPIAEATQLAA